MRLTVREIVKAIGAPIPKSISENELIKGISIDSRLVKPGDLFIALKGERRDGHNFVKEAVNKGAKLILVSKNIVEEKKMPFIKVKDTLSALGDIASYYRSKFDVEVVAITGSNGKTTTKEMVRCLLSDKFKVIASPASFNNFIGVPLTMFKIRESTQIVIQEMETNVLGGIVRLSEIARPKTGIVTNIGETHLESLKTIYGVFREKSELLRVLPPEGTSIINIDDDYYLKLKKASRARHIITFGIKKKANFRAKNIEFKRNCFYFNIEQIRFVLPTLFYKNIYNALSAVSVGVGIFGLSLRKAAKLLGKFSFPPLRSQIVKLPKSIYIINDCFNANPASMKDALLSFDTIKGKSKIAVLGDMFELGKDSVHFHYEIGVFTSCINLKALLCIGKDAYYIGQGARRQKPPFKIIYCKTVHQAVKFLRDVLEFGSFVLIKGSRAMKLERLTDELKYWLENES